MEATFSESSPFFPTSPGPTHFLEFNFLEFFVACATVLEDLPFAALDGTDRAESGSLGEILSRLVDISLITTTKRRGQRQSNGSVMVRSVL